MSSYGVVLNRIELNITSQEYLICPSGLPLTPFPLLGRTRLTWATVAFGLTFFTDACKPDPLGMSQDSGFGGIFGAEYFYGGWADTGVDVSPLSINTLAPLLRIAAVLFHSFGKSAQSREKFRKKSRRLARHHFCSPFRVFARSPLPTYPLPHRRSFCAAGPGTTIPPSLTTVTAACSSAYKKRHRPSNVPSFSKP